MCTDRIEKKILLRASRSRVWRALTDSREFGAGSGSSSTAALAGAKVSRPDRADHRRRRACRGVEKARGQGA